MKKTLVITIVSICLLICSCQTTATTENPVTPVAEKPVVQKAVRTIDEAHFASFGFEFDLRVTGSRQISVSYPSIISGELMSDYALFLARSVVFGSADVDAQSNTLLITYPEDLTDETVRGLVRDFTAGNSSFESYLNGKFDSLEAPVYTLEIDGYVLSFKQVDNSEIIVDFPGIPTQDAAYAVLMAAAAVSPVSLDGTDIYMSSGNRVLYIVPAVFDADQFKVVAESITASGTAEETQVTAPAVTSEPVSVIQIPTVQTIQPAPTAPAEPASPVSPASPVEPTAPAEPEQTPAVLSPGLIMLIIVLAIVAVTCIVALVKRKRK